MREKTLKTVVTFNKTVDAMACEDKAKEVGFPGRMIPVPSQISAGCGLAWCAEDHDRTAIENALNVFDLAYEDLHSVELY